MSQIHACIRDAGGAGEVLLLPGQYPALRPEGASMAAHACSPSLGEVEPAQGAPCPASLACLVLQASERSCHLQTRWTVPEEHPLNLTAGLRVHGYIHTRMHVSSLSLSPLSLYFFLHRRSLPLKKRESKRHSECWKSFRNELTTILGIFIFST